MAGHKKRKQNKIVRYRRPINIGVVFFGFVTVYLIVCVYLFLTSSHVSGYEVLAGSLTSDNSYTGIALRTEEVFSTEKSGYVSYYAREGERVSASSTVYTLDENGAMAELLQESAEGVNLSDENYSLLRGDITTYADQMSDINFSEVYDFKYRINAEVLDMINQNMTDELEGASAEGSAQFTRYPAGVSGIVEYYTDGMEEATVDQLNSSWFDQKAYTKKNLRTEELVGSGEPVYKVLTDENWKIVFPVDDAMADYLQGKLDANMRTQEDGTSIQMTTYVQIRFAKDQECVWPSMTLEYRDGQTYGILSFVNSMVRYAGDRFINFEIIKSEETGLKIPVTTITEKEFYVIPSAYLAKSEDETGVMKQVFDANGQSSVQFVNMTIYYQDEENFYVDPKEENFVDSTLKLESGNTLVAADSDETFQVAEKASMLGVYNINKGYTIFRRIEILQENEEYCIIKEGTSFGISVYDHIALNADTVEESQVIY